MHGMSKVVWHHIAVTQPLDDLSQEGHRAKPILLSTCWRELISSRFRLKAKDAPKTPSGPELKSCSLGALVTHSESE